MPRITISQDREIGRLSGRPEGKGHGCPASQFHRIEKLDDFLVARRVRGMDAPHQNHALMHLFRGFLI